MSNLAKCFLMVLLAFGPLRLNAMVISLEGHVDVGVMFAGEHQVLWNLKSSGSKPHQLISLDAHTGKEQWRINLTEMPRTAAAAVRDVFYFMQGDVLTAARLSNGQILWQTNLFGVPARTNAPPHSLASRAKKRAEELDVLPITIHRGLFTASTPNRFHYSPVYWNGPMLVIGRMAMSGSGCCWNLCFRDWLIIDQRQGRIVDGGPGEILATGGHLVAGDTESVFQIHGGSKTALPHVTEVLKKSPWSPMDSVHGQVGNCMLLAGGHTSSDTAIVVDISRQTSRPLALGRRHNYQQGWVTLKDGFLRYSEYHSSGSIHHAVNPARSAFWVELYDFQGKLQIQQTTKAIQNFWTSFIGVDARGRVILGANDSLVTVEIPSLEMKQWKTKPDARFHMSSDGRRLICSRGDWSAQEMKSAFEDREVIITSVDSESFKPLWEHREKVRAHRER